MYTTAYIGVYTSDDDNARKSCETTLLFGEPSDIHHPREFNWKWVVLPCPHCGFAHSFKRDRWSEQFQATKVTEKDLAKVTY